MPDPVNESPEQESKFHTYATHHIPWYIRAMWIMFWVALVWYIVQFAIPAVKDFF